MEITTELLNYVRHHVSLLVGLLGAWLASVLITVWIARHYLISIPSDYFTKSHRPLAAWQSTHPVLRWAIIVGKNSLGAVFLIAGVVMLLTPGSGWIALLLGLYLMDIPGKREVERRILQRPTILRLVNRMRARARKPALTFTTGPSTE